MNELPDAVAGSLQAATAATECRSPCRPQPAPKSVLADNRERELLRELAGLLLEKQACAACHYSRLRNAVTLLARAHGAWRSWRERIAAKAQNALSTEWMTFESFNAFAVAPPPPRLEDASAF